MYLYPESMTVVARYLLPELDEAACCSHCREKLHVVNPVAIHRLCGIVLCESCFSNALIDYHSSPLLGHTPPCCPFCHHTLTEESLSLTLPPLRYAVQDSLPSLMSRRWQQELERQLVQQAQQLQQAQQAQNLSYSQGFGHIYEPVLFGGRNAIGEEFMVLPDGTAVRAQPTPQPVPLVQLAQQMKDLGEFVRGQMEGTRKWREDRDSCWTNPGANNGTSPLYNSSGNQNQQHNNSQEGNGKGKRKWSRKGNHSSQNQHNQYNQFHKQNQQGGNRR